MLPYESPWMDDDLRTFRETVVRFLEDEMVPHDARWRAQHHVDRALWHKAGETGLLLSGVSGVGAKKLEAYGAEVLRVCVSPA